MSMSTRVTGFAPPDETWQSMWAVWNACLAAHVPVPAEVEKFFGGEPPDPAGVEVDLPVREWNGGLGGAGYELDVSAIPPQVKTLRFWNSW
jgi:hypothetical protein